MLDDADVAALGLKATESGAVVTVAAEPRWLALATTGTLIAVAAPAGGEANRRLLVGGDAGILLAQAPDGETPVATVDLVTGKVQPVVDRPPLVLDNSSGSLPQLAFHPGGRCVVFNGAAHDLPSGSSFDPRSATVVAWW